MAHLFWFREDQMERIRPFPKKERGVRRVDE